MRRTRGNCTAPSDPRSGPTQLRLGGALLSTQDSPGTDAGCKMVSEASPIASLTQALPAALQIRPPGPSRSASSASSRSTGRTSVPRVQLAVHARDLPADIAEGVREVAQTAIRGNVHVVEGDAGPSEQQRHSGSRSGRNAVEAAATWLVRSVSPLRAPMGRRVYCRLRLNAGCPLCRFNHNEQMPPGAMKIECSADDFTAVEPGQDFVVTISYNRPIEGERNGHTVQGAV